MIQVPDFQATISSQTVPQGAWVTLDSYLDYLATQSPPGIGTLSKADWYRILREASLPFNDLWAALELTGSIDPDNDWAARVSALQQHYRRTYRLPKRWVDRALLISAHRTSTNTVAGGVREKSPAWADYSVLASQRFFEKQIRSGDSDAIFAVNVDGYPDGDNNGSGVPPLDSATKPGPIGVAVLDQDQGIIQFDYRVDVHKVFDQVLPSHVDGPNWREPARSGHQPHCPRPAREGVPVDV